MRLSGTVPASLPSTQHDGWHGDLTVTLHEFELCGMVAGLRRPPAKAASGLGLVVTEDNGVMQLFTRGALEDSHGERTAVIMQRRQNGRHSHRLMAPGPGWASRVTVSWTPYDCSVGVDCVQPALHQCVLHVRQMDEHGVTGGRVVVMKFTVKKQRVECTVGRRGGVGLLERAIRTTEQSAHWEGVEGRSGGDSEARHQ